MAVAWEPSVPKLHWGPQQWQLHGLWWCACGGREVDLLKGQLAEERDKGRQAKAAADAKERAAKEALESATQEKAALEKRIDEALAQLDEERRSAPARPATPLPSPHCLQAVTNFLCTQISREAPFPSCWVVTGAHPRSGRCPRLPCMDEVQGEGEAARSDADP